MELSHRHILSLAVPAIVQNITVPLLGLVDLTIAGHLGSAAVMAAVAVGSMIFNVMYWLLGFLRMGTSGLTAQAYGAADGEAVCGHLRRSLLWAVLMGAAILLLQWPLGFVAMRVMGVDGAVAVHVHTYYAICVWGAPAVLGLYALTGWYIGLHDSRLPLLVAVVQNVANIILSLLLVVYGRMGIAGVATGTMVSQWLGLSLSAVMARRRYGRVRQLRRVSEGRAESERQQGSAMMLLLRVNRNIFLRTVCLVAVNLFFTAAGTRLGETVVAANTALLTFYTLFSYFMDGFAYAGEAVCGSAAGGGSTADVHRAVRLLMQWGVGMVVVFTAVYVLGGHLLLQCITSEQTVVRTALHYLPWVMAIPAVGMAAFIYDGVFVGLTDTTGMVVTACMAAVVFFVLYGVGRWCALPANHLLWCSFVAFMLARSVGQWMWMRLKPAHLPSR